MGANCILVVEDDIHVQTSLKELLESEGYMVSVANNGKEALEKFENIQGPCLVLLDLMMPVMDGMEFLKIKKENVRIAPVPVVVVSAVPEKAEIFTDIKIIKKPIQLDLLLKIVKEYCATDDTLTHA